MNADARTHRARPVSGSRLRPGLLWGLGICAIVVLLPAADSGAQPQDAWNIRVAGSNGQPVASARLRIYETADPLLPSQWTTVVDGQATAPWPRGGLAAVIEVIDAKDEPGNVQGAATLVGPVIPSEDGLEIRLPEPRSIQGRVLDPEGKGIAGVRVHAHCENQPWTNGTITFMHFLPAEATSADDGSFALLGLGAYRYYLLCDPGPSWARPEPIAVEPPAGPVTLRLLPGSAHTIRVLGPDGRGVEGARVSVHLPPSKERRNEDLPWAAPHASSGQTAADGTVRLGGIPDRDDLSLWVQCWGRADVATYEQEGWAPADTVVKLSANRIVKGVVRDTLGTPIPDAQVRWSSLSERYTPFHGGRTDESGRFTLGIPGPMSSIWLRVCGSSWAHEHYLGETRLTAEANSTELVIDAKGVLRVKALKSQVGDVPLIIGPEDGGAMQFTRTLHPLHGATLIGLSPGARCSLYPPPNQSSGIN